VEARELPLTPVDVAGRPADPLTGRYLDDQEPRYVNEAAAQLDRRIAELEERAKHPPPVRPEKRPHAPRPPLTDAERAALGLAPKHH
jgi:hypothetical protein